MDKYIRVVSLMMKGFWWVARRLVDLLAPILLKITVWLLLLAFISIISTAIGPRRSADMMAANWTARVLRHMHINPDRLHQFFSYVAYAVIAAGWVVTVITVYLIAKVTL